MSRGTSRPHTSTGFTLVELLIVVMILGILGRVAVANFGSPAAQSKEAALLFDLVTVRTSIERYKLEHDQTYPIVFATQLVIPTAKSGLPGRCFPAYFPNGFPRNPISTLSSVREVVDMPAAPDDSTGWVYSIRTGDFRANLSGNAPSGKPWFDL